MDEQKVYQVALSLIPGVGNFLAKNLISYCGSAKAVFEYPRHKLQKIPGIGTKTAESIISSKLLRQAEEELLKAEKHGAELLAYTDKAYPHRLKQISDAPNILYYKGSVKLEAPKTVAIVGTRQATTYGKQITEQIINELAPYRPHIISGLAYGIDITAHRAALRTGLPTIGVMASGLDIVYPSAHKNTAQEMLAQGGLVCENPFGTQPEAFKFPARNRIIAGMADVVVVIEAAVKGGALITAEIAHSYDREVFAVPGHITSSQSAGCNKLIKATKAHLLESAKDIAYIMDWTLGQEQSKQQTMLFETMLNPEEGRVVELLRQHPGGLHIDELSWRSQIPLSSLASTLLTLEFQDLIRSLPGKKFSLK